MLREMIDQKGSFVFGSDWFMAVHFGRQKKSTINKARSNNIIRFRQNYLCDWIGVSDGGLINISKLIKARVLVEPELSCPRDKRGNFELNEYIMGCDIARSNTENNNKTSIIVLKIIRGSNGLIRQVQIVNIVNPSNGLNFADQAIIIKQIFKRYGGDDRDLSKSRVKAVVLDINGVGQGVLEELLKDVTDYNNDELLAWASINTEDKTSSKNAIPIVFGLKSQGINSDIIRIFIDSVESGKLKLIKPYDDIKDELPPNVDLLEVEAFCFQTHQLIDEVANLKLKKSEKTNILTVEPLVKRMDKDRYSALAYALYYTFVFLNEEQEEEEDDFEFLSKYTFFG